MRKLIVALSLFIVANVRAQLTCEDLQKIGNTYTLTAHKNGKGKLMHTDSSIYNHIKYREFKLTLVSDLPAEIKSDVVKYKFPLKDNDTVLVYDWDIMNHAKMGYNGPAVGKIRFDCKDSVIHIQKYILNKETKNYVPTRFKISKLGKDRFIFYDMDHPYLNIIHYFELEKQ